MNRDGADAEELALKFLTKQGLKLKTRNYTCRLGEIDLILLDGKTVVFVEVRMRSSAGHGSAAESISPRKRQRLLAAAKHYLSTQKTLPQCRFDAVLFDGDSTPVWLRNALEE